MTAALPWWKWLTDPWEASREYRAAQLAARCLLLSQMYPELRKWPRSRLFALAMMTRGVDPEVAQLAALKWERAAEHEAGHR